MVNKESWKQNFSKLDAESQLEVARAISEELKANEEFHITDSYDEEKSREIREFLSALVVSSSSQSELEELKMAITKYDGFSKDIQKFVISGILDAINEGVGFQQQEEAKEVCNLQGHIFEPWIAVDKYSGAVLKKGVYSEGIMTRMCKRCSRVEYKPMMLIKGSDNHGTAK